MSVPGIADLLIKGRVNSLAYASLVVGALALLVAGVFHTNLSNNPSIQRKLIGLIGGHGRTLWLAALVAVGALNVGAGAAVFFRRSRGPIIVAAVAGVPGALALVANLGLVFSSFESEAYAADGRMLLAGALFLFGAIFLFSYRAMKALQEVRDEASEAAHSDQSSRA